MADQEPSNKYPRAETPTGTGSRGDSPDKSENEAAFITRMSEMTRQGFLTLAVSMGEQLGLFEYLAQLSEPQTSQEIATALNFKERYVREWLGSMVCAHIVEVTDEGEEKFWLPKHRQKALAGYSPSNVTHFMLALPISACRFWDIKACFRRDGPAGTAYSQYSHYHEWRDKCMRDRSPTSLRSLLSKAPGLIHKLDEGINVLEVGCSTGVHTFEMARMFPRSTIVGSDICAQEIEAAERRAREEGVSNLSFQVQDCTALPADWTEKWDLVFAIDVYHDMPRTDLGFSETFRVLRKGGMLLFNDIALHTAIRDNKDIPFADFTYSLSTFLCMPTSLGVEGGMGLGACWGVEKALSMMTDAGFTSPRILDEHTGDFMAVKD